MGNQAIALGAVHAGVRIAAGYPGTPSSEILETIAKEKPPGVYAEWSVNEKSALEVAAGAAIAGARSLATMKQVGLNVASDPLMSLNYVGVKAGMVVVVADDPGPVSSQTEQDTRHFARFAKL
ncbi:MAG: indolepyruvate ferredoxin oxidoreductase subunit alpha, partial [Firmicutes bacterium]|nr:indolepyruvate ferredoxin oxidoreductase subunit alpha [Bacillota bacterium]